MGEIIIAAGQLMGEPQKETVSPTREINIVVNSFYIKAVADMGSEEGVRTLEEIAAIKQDTKNGNEYREVDISGWFVSNSHDLLEDLDLNLPDPAPDLVIKVCGVNSDISNLILTLELRRNGFNAGFNRKASCTGRTEPPQTVVNDILDEFPDFFNLK